MNFSRGFSPSHETASFHRNSGVRRNAVSCAGFSFLEVLISLFLVSVMVLFLQAVVLSGVFVRNTESQGIALSVVRNEIESLRAAGYAALPASGSFSDSLLSTLPGGTGTLTVSVYNAKTKQVTASVVWKDAGTTASSTVSITTLITETGGLP